jgi:hypothetical protein
MAIAASAEMSEAIEYVFGVFDDCPISARRSP